MFKDFTFNTELKIKGLIKISATSFSDHRGKLFSSYLKEEFIVNGISHDFNHDKFAINDRKHTLRGLHGDFKSWKMVSVPFGRVFQVVVDNRSDSPTYRKVYTCILDSKDPSFLLLPPGCANGFMSLTENSVYHYKLSYDGDYADANEQFTLPWNDSKLNIEWPNANPILSKRDSYESE